jgi:single-strand DNA-binding protein
MNVFTFTGNLGRECRTGNNGTTPVCNFAVAVKSGFGDNSTTLWIDCALWGKQAESKLVNYLVKGQQVAVSGELGMREHEGKSYLTCRVSSISLVGGQSQGSQNNAPQSQPTHNQSVPQQQTQKHYSQPTQNQPAPMAEPDFDFDDDIPF